MDHSKVKKEEHELDEFHLDYCFPGDEFGYKLAILVAVERGSGMKASIVVPRKGSTGNFAARRVIDLVNECGNKDRDIIVKTDQEEAILYLVDDLILSQKKHRRKVLQAMAWRKVLCRPWKGT